MLSMPITRTIASRCLGVFALIIAVSFGRGAAAFAVVDGKTVPITAAPWTVEVWEPAGKGEPRYAACTGVIIDARHILTAGHCVMAGNSATALQASAFRIEAGVSNFRHPLKSDHRQSRAVSAVRAMPGYTATGNYLDSVTHDLAVLTLSRPLDLHGQDARAAYLPRANAPGPSRESRLVIAGFGYEEPHAGVAYANGTLNEAVNPQAQESCSTGTFLCIFIRGNTCWGDSGLGAVEPGARPIVVGILSEGVANCAPGPDGFVSLSGPAAWRFIEAAK